MKKKIFLLCLFLLLLPANFILLWNTFQALRENDTTELPDFIQKELERYQSFSLNNHAYFLRNRENPAENFIFLNAEYFIECSLGNSSATFLCTNLKNLEKQYVFTIMQNPPQIISSYDGRMYYDLGPDGLNDYCRDQKELHWLIQVDGHWLPCKTLDRVNLEATVSGGQKFIRQNGKWIKSSK